VALATRWPLAALVLALAVYALLRPWSPPGGSDSGLPGPVAGSKVVEDVEVQGDAGDGASPAAPNAGSGVTAGIAEGTAPAPGAGDGGLAPFLASDAGTSAPRTTGGEDTGQSRDAFRAGRDTPARFSPVRSKAGGGKGWPHAKAARKAAEAEARAERKAARASARAKRDRGHARGGKPPHATPHAPAASAHGKPAHAAKKHVGASAPGRAHAPKKHGNGKRTER
jgi:hypothetical protein